MERGWKTEKDEKAKKGLLARPRGLPQFHDKQNIEHESDFDQSKDSPKLLHCAETEEEEEDRWYKYGPYGVTNGYTYKRRHMEH